MKLKKISAATLMVITLFIFLLLNNQVFSQILSDPISFRVPLTISNAGAVNTGTLYFGGHTSATYCRDTVTLADGVTKIMEEEQPPKPPSAIFDIRFIDNRTGAGKCLGEGTIINLTQWSTTITRLDTFRVSLQTGDPGFPITITWPDLSAFGPIATAEMRELGGTQIVNMKTATSMEITDDLVQGVRIYTNVNINGVKPEEGLPETFGLNQNYPNPFNPTTTMTFSIPMKSNVDIVVFNVLGQKVKTLVSENILAGNYSVVWDGTQESGVMAASGIYFVKMNAISERSETYSQTLKAVLMK
jgi:hypothetical protein